MRSHNRSSHYVDAMYCGVDAQRAEAANYWNKNGTSCSIENRQSFLSFVLEKHICGF